MCALLLLIFVGQANGRGQIVSPIAADLVLDRPAPAASFSLFRDHHAAPILLSPGERGVVVHAAQAFQADLAKVSGTAPVFLPKDAPLNEAGIIIVGTIGQSALLQQLVVQHTLDLSPVRGKWESAMITIVKHPLPGVRSALVIAGSDPRGTAYALFDLSRALGVSPWNWWADVPPHHHSSASFTKTYIQQSPAVQYRGIFINDEDWGFRPWAARKMDPKIKNIGPHAYARVFELLLRLHANTLWPAMHPGSLPFHALPENARLADEWGIIMGSSHSESMLRNNVGEWNQKRDGPWNYQLNREAIDRYWDSGLKENGKFENVYTVGMRGVHDGPLVASGSLEQKAKLIEQVIADQRRILAQRVSPDLARIPQVLWLYKEAIDLYRAGMKVPDDVMLGWTDDNYGYIRQMPSAAEQARTGGSALYYHISYWGAPQDYLWLCSTPPDLLREELVKAWDHGIRRMWILNVGDIKPGETDIDYFLQLAWRLPEIRHVPQREILKDWFTEQFTAKDSEAIANMMESYYHLNFIRKPEFMGFNTDNDDIHRTAFNPLAWGDQNALRLKAWENLSTTAQRLQGQIAPDARDAYYELVGYPIEAAAAQNAKLLWNDRTYLDQHFQRESDREADALRVASAYSEIQGLTVRYNQLAGGKWESMMSADPRHRHVFEMPVTAQPGAVHEDNLPSVWEPSPVNSKTTAEVRSIPATRFQLKQDSKEGHWEIWGDLGLSSGSIMLGDPGKIPAAHWVSGGDPGKCEDCAWLEYSFTIDKSEQQATASIYLLPTFPVDSDHKLRYAMSVDSKPAIILDASGTEEHAKGVSDWSSNVLRNAEVQTVSLGQLEKGTHRIRLIYGEPGVVFEHITITTPGSQPAYPFAPASSP